MDTIFKSFKKLSQNVCSPEPLTFSGDITPVVSGKKKVSGYFEVL